MLSSSYKNRGSNFHNKFTDPDRLTGVDVQDGDMSLIQGQLLLQRLIMISYSYHEMLKRLVIS